MTTAILLRLLLLVLLSLWSVVLVVIAVGLMTDSSGGMGQLPLVVVGGNLIAALPFLTAMGPTMVIVARVLGVTQGAAIILCGYLVSGMAVSISSMGMGHGSGFTPLMGVTAFFGISLMLLAIFAPAIPTG